MGPIQCDFHLVEGVCIMNISALSAIVILSRILRAAALSPVSSEPTSSEMLGSLVTDLLVGPWWGVMVVGSAKEVVLCWCSCGFFETDSLNVTPCC